MKPAEHNENQQPNLKAFLDNELPLWRRFAVRLHLTRCPACQEEMRAMQQIGTELRGQSIDPLDPGLRARILATVREMPPEPIKSEPARKPVLIWSGAAVAALFVAAVFVSRPQFSQTPLSAVNPSSATLPSAASPAAEDKSGALAYAPKRADQSSAVSSMPGADAPASAHGNAQGSMQPSLVFPVTPSQNQIPHSESAKRERVKEGPHPASSFASPEGQYSASAPAVPNNRGVVGSGFGGDAQKMAVSPPMTTGQPSEPKGFANSSHTKAANKPQAIDPGSPRDTEPVGIARVFGRVSRIQRRVVLERAGFDLDGYQFVTQGGQRIAVPFKKRLDAVRFARATDGRMELAETASAPILYLSPADSLVNDAAPGARWQPLPPGVTETQPLSVYPAPDWEQFTAMRWYPNMVLVGGLTPSSSGAEPAALPGSHVQIGATLYPDFAAYHAYADAHPDALRLHQVYAKSPTPVTPPASTKAAGRTRSKSHP